MTGGSRPDAAPRAGSSGTREAVLPRVAVVVGAGAVGSFLGATLAATGWDVTLLARRGGGGGERSPLAIHGPGGSRSVTVRRVADPSSGPASPDVVILAVRTFDLPGAIAAARRWPDTPILTAQNGVGAEAEVAAARTSPIVAASLTTAVELVEGGVARRRTGGIGLAPVRGDVARLVHDLADAFADGGLPSQVCRDPAAMKWSKLLANLVGNATSGLLDMDPGAIFADADGFDLERRQLREAMAVMRAQGLSRVSLPGAQVGALLFGMSFPAILARPVLGLAIGRARGGKSPSLRLRLRGGGSGPTEARWLNGAVADAGRRLGVPTPVNACLATLVDDAASDPVAGGGWVGRPDLLRSTALTWRDDR